MSETRRLRRDAARQQAQQRLRKRLAARRGKANEASGFRRWPSLFLRRRTLYIIGALALVLFMAFPVFAPQTTSAPATSPSPEVPTPVLPPAKIFASPPGLVLSPGRKYQAVVQTTKGAIKIDLLDSEVPATVNNFVFLAQQRYYNDLAIDKAEPNSRVEMGSFSRDGASGPGYTLPAEPSRRSLDVGVVATVPQGSDAIGGQFLIALADQPGLGSGYTPFGRVTDGLDVARSLTAGDRIIAISITESDAQ